MSRDITESLEAEYERTHDETGEPVSACDTIYDPVCNFGG